MSLSWRDRLDIAVCPDQVILIRRGAFSKRIIAKEIFRRNDSDDWKWEAVVPVLEDALKDKQYRKCNVTVVLSNAFVHFLLLPWSGRLIDDEEELAFVRHRFAQVHGEASNGWELRWNNRGECRIAVGVQKSFLRSIETAISASQSHLSSVQPYLMSASNRWRRKVKGPNPWLAIFEPGHVCIASFKNAAWRSFRSLRLPKNFVGELASAFEREVLLLGAESAHRSLFTNLSPEQKLHLNGQWSVHHLELPSCRDIPAELKAEYAMPLTV